MALPRRWGISGEVTQPVSAPYLTGQFLVALPGIGDPNFERAVVALCAHDAEGALGIDLAQDFAEPRLHVLLDQLALPLDKAPDAPLALGGPVEPERGFVLHSRDWSGQDTIDVAGRWALSGSVDVLRAIAEGRGPRRWKVALGYAGWGPGQLDGEMSRHGWLSVDTDASLIFDTPPGERWGEALRRAGVDPRLLSAQSGHV